MKMRILKLNSTYLLELLQGQTKTSPSNLPHDLELIDVKYDAFSGKAMFVVRSDAFEDIPESYPIPEFNLQNIKSYAKTSRPATDLKPKQKVAKERTINSNQDIKGFQKEFNPEQRELLSFQLDGDYLIVKPVKYLKKEWNEINEVVKNIGGEWVKGSIISYWKIPIR